MSQFVESDRLAGLKDRFIRYWPNVCCVLVNLESRYLADAGRVLFVGSGRNSTRKGPQVVNIDIRPFEGVNVVSDAQALPFKAGTFEALVCHQVLEHVPDADKAVREMGRVLKPGGILIVTVPFYFPFHASPYDYRRWTVPGLRITFGHFYEVASGIHIGPVSAMLTAFQHFAGLLIPNFYLSYAARAILGFVIFPFKYLDLLLSRLPNAIYMAASVFYVGRKPS